MEKGTASAQIVGQQKRVSDMCSCGVAPGFMSLRGSESAPAVPDAAVHAAPAPAPTGLYTKPAYMPRPGRAETTTIRRFAYFEPNIIRMIYVFM